MLLPYRGEVETVRFDSGGLQLVGQLVLPEGEGPSPAIVLLHGSGPMTRGGPWVRVHTNLFLRHGFAVLSFDKRGCGGSDGDFETATLADFAADASAAVDYLLRRAEIAGSAIGLLGSSESAWFTPQVAVENPRVAFLVQRSGPPLPYGETFLFEVENELRAAAIDPAGIDAAIALRRQIWDYYRLAGSPSSAETERAAAIAAVERATREAWCAHWPLRVSDYDRERYAKWMAEIDYDPRPYLARLAVPVLAVFGEGDVNVPAGRSIATLERLRDEHGLDVTIRLYPNVGHSLADWRHPWQAFFVDGYLDLVGSWAAAQVGADPPR